MIETVERRRSAGDWRGACAAADVDIFFNPDSVRRRHGAAVAESLLADLHALAPDLLRWQLPRCGHGAGQLLEGLLIPLAEYPVTGPGTGPGPGFDAGTTVTLAAATPGFALAAGQRIVLTVLAGDARSGRAHHDPAMYALLAAVHRRSAARYDLRRHRTSWDALCAARPPELSSAETGAAADLGGAEEIVRLQDEGHAVEAWTAAGFEVSFGASHPAGSVAAAEQRRLRRWLASLPVDLPRLAEHVREALPGARRAVIRCGDGAVVLSGFLPGPGEPGLDECGRPRADIVSPRTARALCEEVPVVPEAAWTRPLDPELLRLGLLEAHELHPLVASALTGNPGAPRASEEWLQGTVLGLEAQHAVWVAGRSRSEVLVRCGTDLHRVAQVGGRWQAVDHEEHAARETLLTRLGGASNPCRAAARHLGGGQHVIELVERLLEHGRAAEARLLLQELADAATAPEDYTLPDGSTVGQAFAALRENTLRLRMTLAGAPPAPDNRSTRIQPSRTRARRGRKGEPARLRLSR